MNYKHGGKRSSLYAIWCGIKARCTNPKNPRYVDYGGRGITMCDEWLESFAAFRRDMGERPPCMSIDRIDNDKGYEPGNCRWATQTVQCRNTRANRLLAVSGVEKTMTEWAEQYGISKGTIWKRLDYGWSEQDAVTVPLVKKRRGNHPTTKYHSQSEPLPPELRGTRRRARAIEQGNVDADGVIQEEATA